MFTLIVTMLAVLVVLGFLFRIADATTTDTASRSAPSMALRASETLRPSAHAGTVR